MKERSAVADPTLAANEEKRLLDVAEKHKISLKVKDILDNKYTTEFKRSGFSYSKRLQSLVVKNNAMHAKAVKINQRNDLVETGSSKITIRNLKDKIPLSSRTIRVKLLPSELDKTKEERALVSSCASVISQSRRSILTNPEADPLQTFRAIRKILHPHIPEEATGGFAQTVCTPINS
eukprot:TRINITY_DN8226_c0_g1_i2.p1 TRINITY_DN8226_c0_g1~~TRINITY_DN8226_c0_g1_i2.p1  ORF type:complete len:178 (-),score=24.10 TRINITY_DN8226_c0_g1_i2:486-1019(-)